MRARRAFDGAVRGGSAAEAASSSNARAAAKRSVRITPTASNEVSSLLGIHERRCPPLDRRPPPALTPPTSRPGLALGPEGLDELGALRLPSSGIASIQTTRICGRRKCWASYVNFEPMAAQVTREQVLPDPAADSSKPV